jgi:hypothetical protein
VPAGNPDGGEWTTGDGGSGSPSNSSTLDGSAGLRIAQGSDWRLLPINLIDEEEPNGPGHAIRKHVEKSQAELVQELQEHSFRVGTTELVRIREGSFDSISSANDLVNRTLQKNSGEVDLIASGQLQRKYIQFDFGFTTGYEMYVPPSGTEPELRDTTGVGVVILYDPSSPRRFRVLTAYPRNFD